MMMNDDALVKLIWYIMVKIINIPTKIDIVNNETVVFVIL